MAEASSATNDLEIFRQLEEYPWDNDKEFQGGLSAILGPKPSPSQIYDLTLRAQCFYLSRKRSIPIDFNAYKAYLSTRPLPETPPNTTTTMSISPSDPPSNRSNPGPHLDPSLPLEQKTAPYPPTFAQIVELIQTGAPIPGIREIPDTLLTDQASQPTLPKRRKPWEKDVPEEQLAGKDGGAIGGTFGDQRDEYIEQELPEN